MKDFPFPLTAAAEAVGIGHELQIIPNFPPSIS
jgi:hypothetical protein